jgi:hypothetical protein
MKKIKMLSILLFCLLAVTVVYSQDVVLPVKKSIFSGIFDWNTIFNIVMGLIGILGGTTLAFWKKAKIKIRQAGELLIKFADAVDDDNVDANEKTDLSAAARDLVSNNNPTILPATKDLV